MYGNFYGGIHGNARNGEIGGREKKENFILVDRLMSWQVGGGALRVIYLFLI